MGFYIDLVRRHEVDQLGKAGALSAVVSHGMSIARFGDGVNARSSVLLVRMSVALRLFPYKGTGYSGLCRS